MKFRRERLLMLQGFCNALVVTVILITAHGIARADSAADVVGSFQIAVVFLGLGAIPIFIEGWDILFGDR